MEFIKEETEDVKIEEAFRVKHEDVETQTGLIPLKEESQELNEMEDKVLHEKHHDFITGDSFSCSQFKKTTFKKDQKTGARSHFTCQQCGKSFSKKGNLEVHMNIHTGAKPYTCPQCEKSFINKETLKRHIRIHTGEKPYNCKLCGSSFSQTGHLNKHMRIHVEQSFTCHQCGSGFRRKISLNNHMRTHSRSQLYVSLAWKEFLRQEAL